MNFCITTLTHNDVNRDAFLKKTIDSFIKNTDFDGVIDWFIHCNGKNELIDEVVKESIEKYGNIINFKYSYSEKNMGCGVGINYLNSLVTEYEFVLFLEGDWICLPKEVSGHDDWLRDCLSYMDENKTISQVLLRRYISDYDDRQYGLGYWIKESNIKNVVKRKNQYLELVRKEYVNNPHIRRTKDFYDAGVLPLKEFYDDEGNPCELKGMTMWGQAEIDAYERGYVLNSSYMLLGNMVHCETWNHYEKYDDLCKEIKTCGKYLETGCGGCKYGFFFPVEVFCNLCDHSKGYVDLEQHGNNYVKNLGYMTHKSNYSDVFWYIDNIHLISHDIYEVSGWIFSKEGNIERLRIGDKDYTNVIHGLQPRKDVKEVYTDLPNELVGWTFTVSSSNISSDIDVYMELGGYYLNIGNLTPWLVYKSGFNPNSSKDIIVVDNFYMDPDLVRNYAINNLTYLESGYHKGKRSDVPFILNGTLEKFEQILGRPIYNWNHPNYANGRFQYCTSTDPIVYHVDSQNYAAMVYLTPDAPLQSGTATYRSIHTNKTKFDEPSGEDYEKTFKGVSSGLNFYDKTSFEIVDNIANVYNRLVLFDSKNIHAAVNYFGDTKDNSRFFHLFFFDI